MPISLLGAVLVCTLVHAQDRVVAKVPDGLQLVESSLRFSADGARVAFVAEKGDSFLPVTGSEVGDAYDEVAPPVISPGGDHVFFRVMKRDKKGAEKWTLLQDGKKIAQSGWVGPVVVSAAGVPAYWTFEDRETKGGCVLHFGKKETKEWQSGDLYWAPRISADGKLALSTATRDEDWLMVTLSDKGVEQRQGVGVIHAVASRPGSTEVLATTLVLRNGEWPREGQPRRYALQRMNLGERLATGKLSEGYSSAGSPTFSADGKHHAYKVADDLGKMGVALDEQKDAPRTYAFVDELVFSPDGSSLAYAACLEGALVFPAGFSTENKLGLEVLEGVTAEDGKWVLVTGETKGAEYRRVKLPSWSREGSTVAFAARTDTGWCVVAGENVSEPCDGIATVAWDGDKVRYGCFEGTELRWCELVTK